MVTCGQGRWHDRGMCRRTRDGDLFDGTRGEDDLGADQLPPKSKRAPLSAPFLSSGQGTYRASLAARCGNTLSIDVQRGPSCALLTVARLYPACTVHIGESGRRCQCHKRHRHALQVQRCGGGGELMAPSSPSTRESSAGNEVVSHPVPVPRLWSFQRTCPPDPSFP